MTTWLNTLLSPQRLPPSRLDVMGADRFAWGDAAAEQAAPVTGWWCGSSAASRPKE